MSEGPKKRSLEMCVLGGQEALGCLCWHSGGGRRSLSQAGLWYPHIVPKQQAAGMRCEVLDQGMGIVWSFQDENHGEGGQLWDDTASDKNNVLSAPVHTECFLPWVGKIPGCPHSHRNIRDAEWYCPATWHVTTIHYESGDTLCVLKLESNSVLMFLIYF